MILSLLYGLCFGLSVVENQSLLEVISNGSVGNTTTNGLTPDVVGKAPSMTIEVKYPSGVEVNNGNELTPTQVKDEPSVNWTSEANQIYTLVMTDPDVPEAAAPQVKHWLVVNIPGSDVSKGEVLASYVGSGPPKGTGLHRYIFLVYKQSSKLSADAEKAVGRMGRLKWVVKDFAKKYNLGEPVAGNFYRAQYDSYVDELHAKMAKSTPQGTAK